MGNSAHFRVGKPAIQIHGSALLAFGDTCSARLKNDECATQPRSKFSDHSNGRLTETASRICREPYENYASSLLTTGEG